MLLNDSNSRYGINLSHFIEIKKFFEYLSQKSAKSKNVEKNVDTHYSRPLFPNSKTVGVQDLPQDLPGSSRIFVSNSGRPGSVSNDLCPGSSLDLPGSLLLPEKGRAMFQCW
jgi:hypothetical protein